MKLAIVTAYPPSKVTLNEYAYHLVKHFRQKENITELVLLTDTTQGAKDINFTEVGCKITVKECWTFNSYLNIIKVTKAINQVKPDAVLFNLQFMKFGDKKIAAALGLMLPLVCKLKKIPNIVLLHNIMEQVDLGRAGFTSNKIMQKIYGLIGGALTRLILQADTVTVTMQKYVEILSKKYNAKNVKLIPHGTFEILEEPSYETPLEPFKIMTFGKFGTYKKVENMIKAIEMLREVSDINMEIVIAGTDNPNTPGYLESVKQKYNYVQGLTFTGYVAEEDVPKLFKESTVVVFPYTSTTGSSGVLHQAGSYGKAVVMPDLGDLALLVQDEGYKGEFFDAESPSSLAIALQKILEDNAYRVELERANYKAATAYPMSRIVDMYINTFEAIRDKKSEVTTVQSQEVIL
ncbi:glycosyltransferase [Hyunsoonleella pacifica]|uniref:Glycosyltransferase n=1 Tax=Hyunsoonleella pacifica TaxID=1080224 RepID=A0A4Q9FQ64_9FLAO|nr:glycosyltransferase [Hyunsoonleella pacifica]TBN17480.1 glycosyltransferase [Hyunsoonleella pacifica]GGD11640.1 glycosyl transferase family 1 [Hyunsoonleella pacifica]